MFCVFVFVCAGLVKVTVTDDVDFTSTVGAIFGGLASLMILSSCFIICKYNTFF